MIWPWFAILGPPVLVATVLVVLLVYERTH